MPLIFVCHIGIHFTSIQHSLLQNPKLTPVVAGLFNLSVFPDNCSKFFSTVTVARSVEMKHKPLITSAVAHETAKLFEKAGL